MIRWTVCLAVAAAPLAWWWSAAPVADHAVPAVQSAAAPKPAGHNSLDLERRGLSAPWGDLFAVPAKPAPRRPDLLAVVPELPKAPTLPYKYDGSGELQGRRFVYLAHDGKSFVVHAGDTLDGTYAVENVARDHAVLRYLPLGIRQVLMYQPGAAPPQELAAEPATSRPLVPQVDVPAEVVLGQEFVLTVALPGAGPLRATVEVGYDAEVLSTLGADVRRPGRALVEVSGGAVPRAQLRFKVLADNPAFTDIDLQVSATDGAGKRVPVSAPSAHTVSLVLPGA